MIYAKGRRPLTCYHEGGHVLARWFFGFDTDSVEVLSVEEVRAGVLLRDRHRRPVRAEGLVAGYDIHFRFGPAEMGFRNPDDHASYVRDGRRRSEIGLVELWAGVAAEAAYTKRSWLACVLAGGQADADQAKQIASVWHNGEEGSPLNLACSRASALIRSPMGWQAVKALAERLYKCGRLEGAEIAEVCREAYEGQRPEYDAWSACWPPSLRQIRRGIVPPPRPRDSIEYEVRQVQVEA